MISNPRVGWCDFKLGEFTGHPSYVTDAPTDLLDAFINYYDNGYGACVFDEEGAKFVLFIESNFLCIICSRMDMVVYDFSDLKISDLAQEVIHDIESNLDGWANNFYVDADIPKERDKFKKAMVEKIAQLKEKINGIQRF